MTRATPDYVTLPSDAANTGAKTPTIIKAQGANQVEAPLVIPDRYETVKGVYRAGMAIQSVVASAHNATSTGFLWMSMPAAATTRGARLRKMELSFQHSASTTMPTLPRIGLARYTFTGTASGATLAGAKVDPDAPNPSADFRTAVTGMTVTLNTDPGSLLSIVVVPAMHNVTAAGLLFSSTDVQQLVSLQADEDEWPLILPGQGLCLYQLDNGTTTDTRRFGVSLTWDEIDL